MPRVASGSSLSNAIRGSKPASRQSSRIRPGEVDARALDPGVVAQRRRARCSGPPASGCARGTTAYIDSSSSRRSSTSAGASDPSRRNITARSMSPPRSAASASGRAGLADRDLGVGEPRAAGRRPPAGRAGSATRSGPRAGRAAARGRRGRRPGPRRARAGRARRGRARPAARPASVSSAPPRERMTSGAPTSASSAARCCETAGWVKSARRRRRSASRGRRSRTASAGAGGHT